MKIRNFLFITILLITILSCKKEKDTNALANGIYKGTFKVVYSSQQFTGKVTLTIQDENFHCIGDSNQYPAGGSGAYIITKDKITFKDKNLWTADFDWNLILSGDYDYSWDGRCLKIFENKNNTGCYAYDLVKQ